MDNILPDKKAVGLLSAGHLISDLYGGFITPIMPLIAAKLGITLGLVGLLYSISGLGSSLLQPFFGFISDLLIRRFFIFWGIIFSAIFISLTGYVHSVWVLGALLFLGNMGVGFFHPQATAQTGHFSGKEINNFMGIFIACGTIGYAMGPLFSSFLVGNFGLNSTLLAVIPGFTIAFLLYKFLPKIPLKIDKHHSKDIFATVLGLKKILVLLAFVSVIRALSVVSFNIYMPFVWQKYHFSVFTIGILITLFSFFGGIASYIGGKLNNTLGSRFILAASMLPSIPCLLGTLYFVKSVPVLSFALFVISGFILTLATSVNIVIAQKAAPENMGMVSGIIGGFSWGLAGLALTPIGFLAARFGIESVLGFIAFAPVLGAVAIGFMSEKFD